MTYSCDCTQLLPPAWSDYGYNTNRFHRLCNDLKLCINHRLCIDPRDKMAVIRRK